MTTRIIFNIKYYKNTTKDKNKNRIITNSSFQQVTNLTNKEIEEILIKEAIALLNGKSLVKATGLKPFFNLVFVDFIGGNIDFKKGICEIMTNNKVTRKDLLEDFDNISKYPFKLINKEEGKEIYSVALILDKLITEEQL